MFSLYLVSIIAALCASFCILEHIARSPLAFATVDEDGTKIAPDLSHSHLQAKRRSESEEAATQAYLHQRRIGNTQKASKIGSRMADEIIITRYPDAPVDLAGETFIMQLKVLCAFAVNKALEEHAPNAIVGQSALSAFYDAVQERDPDFYDAIGEYGAFSLYMYLYRSESGKSADFARAFAEVCGDRESEALSEAGYAAYTTAYNHAVSLIEGADFN